ncbi:MAG: septum formation initiator family protein [Candidatus Zixiibacteriota bacterium]|jgi:cell division protein FtsB
MSRRGETVHVTKSRRRRIIAISVAAALLFGLLVYVFVFSRHGYLRRRELARDNARLSTEVEELRHENALLREELERLDDPEAVEKIAREELGLVKEGETVYRFVEKDEEAGTAEEDPETPVTP